MRDSPSFEKVTKGFHGTSRDFHSKNLFWPQRIIGHSLSVGVFLKGWGGAIFPFFFLFPSCYISFESFCRQITKGFFKSFNCSLLSHKIPHLSRHKKRRKKKKRKRRKKIHNKSQQLAAFHSFLHSEQVCIPGLIELRIIKSHKFNVSCKNISMGEGKAGWVSKYNIK